MAAHERALALSVETRQRLTIGISDHGRPGAAALIARMNAQDPELLIEIRIGSSGDLLQSYAGQLPADRAHERGIPNS